MSRPLQAALRKAARSSDPYISLLLKETNNIEAARNELRWLREYVEPLRKSHIPAPESGQWIRESSKQPYDHLLTLCQRRAEGEPLQYILGSQPFGELDIKCQRGVLIPRPETEAYTTYLASKISNGLLEEQLNTLVHKARCRRVPTDTPRSSPEFKILDACSGSGCISLLLHNLLSNYIKTYGELRIDGADISEKALQLSNLNLKRNITKGFLKPEAASEVRFMKYDVMQKPTKLGRPDLEPYHIIISNPPYISRLEYETKIPRSVRDWEPKLALVPLHVGTPGNADPADIFYQALIKKYCTNMSSAFMLVMEIGDEMQAKRVLDMAIRGYDLHKTNNVSVWRDSPDARPSGEDLVAGGMSVRTEGQGNVRAVVFLRHLSAIRWPDEEKSG